MARWKRAKAGRGEDVDWVIWQIVLILAGFGAFMALLRLGESALTHDPHFTLRDAIIWFFAALTFASGTAITWFTGRGVKLRTILSLLAVSICSGVILWQSISLPWYQPLLLFAFGLIMGLFVRMGEATQDSSSEWSGVGLALLISYAPPLILAVTGYFSAKYFDFEPVHYRDLILYVCGYASGLSFVPALAALDDFDGFTDKWGIDWSSAMHLIIGITCLMVGYASAAVIWLVSGNPLAGLVFLGFSIIGTGICLFSNL